MGDLLIFGNDVLMYFEYVLLACTIVVGELVAGYQVRTVSIPSASCHAVKSACMRLAKVCLQGKTSLQAEG